MAYYLKNTLSEGGTVNRGICKVGDDGYLLEMEEHKGIPKDNNYPPETIASMTFFGLHPEIFPMLESGFERFLKTADINTDEFLLSSEIGRLVKTGKIKMKVLPSDELWYGITNPEDKDFVIAAIRKIESEGKYER
jgi:hypothetical protein